MARIMEIVKYTNELLNCSIFNDYCPNGLQVEGRPEVNKLVSGVTANLALVTSAMENGADTILVHHGYFWRGENPCITGMKRQRLQILLDADVNLLAYHLPLDAHPDYGNNAQLARILNFKRLGTFGQGSGPDIGMFGELASPMAGEQFADFIESRLVRPPLYISGDDRLIKTIGWCTGAAQNYIEQAADLGLDAFLTGEASEPTVHIAREMGIHFFAAGHHATERYGVQALGEHLAEKFGITHQFIEIDNPV